MHHFDSAPDPDPGSQNDAARTESPRLRFLHMCISAKFKNVYILMLLLAPQH
jgi:hypothetical protein